MESAADVSIAAIQGNLDEEIETVAKRILEQNLEAFLELAK